MSSPGQFQAVPTPAKSRINSSAQEPEGCSSGQGMHGKTYDVKIDGEFQFGSGAYLVYEPRDFGTLWLVWSRELVPGAIGFFDPTKSVPAFKFTQQGRTMLKRKADDKMTFYAGWQEFLKVGLLNWCCHKFHILPIAAGTEGAPQHEIQMVFLERDTNSVFHLYSGQWWDFEPKYCQAICVCHPDCEEFDVGTHAPSYFQQLGRVHGSAFEVEISDAKVSEARSTVTAPAPRCSQSVSNRPFTGEQPDGAGAYLVYKTENNGTLFLVWSERPVDDAIAYFEPQKTVPKFKYSQRGGRYELKRNCDDRRTFVTAWSSFLKEGLVQWESQRIYIYDHFTDEQEVLVVWLERNTNIVHRVRTQCWWETDASKIDQIVVVHPDVTEFHVGTMAPALFSQKGAQKGSVFEPRKI